MQASIIIPHFEPHKDTPSMLAQTLDSIVATTAPGQVEIIVVDGGSAPETRAWLARWKDTGKSLTLAMLSNNAGFTRHINIGLTLAEKDTPFIVLMNSDIECDEGWLDAMLQAMTDDPQVGIVGCQVRDMVDRTQIVHGGAIGPAKHKLGFVDKGDWQEMTFDDDYLTFACVMLRRQMVNQIGPLDEQFVIHCSDSDYCYRAREAGWKLCYQPSAIVYHEQEGCLRYMRGAPQIEAILQQDQERFRNKWKPHLLRLGQAYEFPWQEEEATTQSSSCEAVPSAASSPSP